MRKLSVLLASLVLLCMTQYAAFAGAVLVEAESFAELGGWSVDQQMIDVIDSSVLLAHGYGRPVADATTSVTFPEPGEYRVFVHTRNWVAPWTPNEAPGTFHLLIDGKPLPTIFGTKSDPWFWEFGGKVTITSPQQRCQVTLHDTTGFDGRCDAILFVSDADFTPPEDSGELTTLRRKLLGLTASPNDVPQYPNYAGLQNTQSTTTPSTTAASEEFDLVVCGGGIAGTCAAVAAARLGVKVALVHNRPVLGGNNSSEVRVHLQGRTHYPPYPNLGNLVYELDPLQTGNAQRGEVYRDGKKLDVVAAEPNITLLLNHHVVAVATEKRDEKTRRITSVIARNIVTNAESRLVSKMFVDATGDGTIGFLAGAAHRMGRESRSETGESLAPEKPDALVMGASTQWYSEEVAEPTSFPKLPWAVQFTAESILPALDGEWDWETGMNRDQIGDAERIRDHALRAVYGHWAYMKNECGGEWREKVARRQLSWVAFIAGKRESRRILGDVILQEQDIVEQRPFDDACVVTTWTIDLHYPTQHQQKHFPQEEFRTVAAHKKIVPYAIPYRSFYSRDVDNLFMAGRCISVTHVALGTIRVQRTGGMMGEVVGMAASLCREHKTTPRGVYEKYLPELIALMTTGVAPHPERYYPTAAPMGVTQTTMPPAWLPRAGKNLAREAAVNVSSTYADTPYPAKNINDGQIDTGNNAPRWVSAPSDKPHWIELTWTKPVRISATRFVTGQSGASTPIQNGFLQYRTSRNSDWIDIAESRFTGNTKTDVGIEFPSVEAVQCRFVITVTPGQLARIWEWELYDVPAKNDTK